MGLGLLLPSQACILRSQELHAEQGPFPWGLSPRAVGHEGRPQLPEVGQGRAWAGQSLHPVPGAKQTLMGRAGGGGGRAQGEEGGEGSEEKGGKIWRRAREGEPEIGGRRRVGAGGKEKEKLEGEEGRKGCKEGIKNGGRR